MDNFLKSPKKGKKTLRMDLVLIPFFLRIKTNFIAEEIIPTETKKRYSEKSYIV